MSANRKSQNAAIWLSGRLPRGDAERFRRTARSVLAGVLTRAELADFLGVSDQYVDALLTPGKPLTRRAARKLYAGLTDALLSWVPAHKGFPIDGGGWRVVDPEIDFKSQFAQLRELAPLLLSQAEQLLNFWRYDGCGPLGWRDPSPGDKDYAYKQGLELALAAFANGVIPDSSIETLVRLSARQLAAPGESDGPAEDWRDQWILEDVVPAVTGRLQRMTLPCGQLIDTADKRNALDE